MKNFIIVFTLFSLNLLSQNSSREKVNRSEIFVGLSSGIQQMHLMEYTLSSKDLTTPDGPHWILLFQGGYNYKIYNMNKISFVTGLQIHEKGASHYFVDALNTQKEIPRSDLTLMLLLFALHVEYRVKAGITTSFGLTYGRDVFHFIPLNIREIALTTGLKVKIYKNLNFGLMLNQGLNAIKHRNVDKFNTNIDFNLILSF